MALGPLEHSTDDASAYTFIKERDRRRGRYVISNGCLQFLDQSWLVGTECTKLLFGSERFPRSESCILTSFTVLISIQLFDDVVSR